MNARVRIGKDEVSGEWKLYYRRYNVARVIRTGTHDQHEAEAMADELAERLEDEQVEKAKRRADWRPDGLDIQSPPPSPAPAGPFNAPRLVKR